jgi:hypothetical protein
VARGNQSSAESSPYVSGNELAERWQCSRSSVERIARRAGLTRLCLGEGRNGIVRHFREELEAYAASWQVKASARPARIVVGGVWNEGAARCSVRQAIPRA